MVFQQAHQLFERNVHFLVGQIFDTHITQQVKLQRSLCEKQCCCGHGGRIHSLLLVRACEKKNTYQTRVPEGLGYQVGQHTK